MITSFLRIQLSGRTVPELCQPKKGIAYCCPQPQCLTPPEARFFSPLHSQVCNHASSAHQPTANSPVQGPITASYEVLLAVACSNTVGQGGTPRLTSISQSQEMPSSYKTEHLINPMGCLEHVLLCYYILAALSPIDMMRDFLIGGFCSRFLLWSHHYGNLPFVPTCCPHCFDCKLALCNRNLMCYR